MVETSRRAVNVHSLLMTGQYLVLALRVQVYEVGLEDSLYADVIAVVKGTPSLCILPYYQGEGTKIFRCRV